MNMASHPVRSEMTLDTLGDTYFVRTECLVRVLARLRPTTGALGVDLSELSAIRLSVSG